MTSLDQRILAGNPDERVGPGDALIGYTGFVGSSLLRQHGFAACYRSTNIAESRGRRFEIVVCAGAPAQKWLANRRPEADGRNIDALIGHLGMIECRTMVLISTVDVFAAPEGVDESTPVTMEGLHAYGANRRRLELAVESAFPSHLIVRLPGLVGPGLRKNVLYDCLNDNNLAAIDSRSRFQFYPMVNLWSDVARAMDSRLRLVHLTAEPISVRDAFVEGFGRDFRQSLAGAPAAYDMRTLHAAIFGGSGRYQYSRREAILAIRAYAQSEPRSDAPKAGAS